MIRTTFLLILAISLAGCLNDSSPAANVSAQPLDGGCVAMRSHFPIKYHYPPMLKEDAERVVRVNAAYAGACP